MVGKGIYRKFFQIFLKWPSTLLVYIENKVVAPAALRRARLFFCVGCSILFQRFAALCSCSTVFTFSVVLYHGYLDAFLFALYISACVFTFHVMCLRIVVSNSGLVVPFCCTWIYSFFWIKLEYSNFSPHKEKTDGPLYDVTTWADKKFLLG